MDSRAALSYYLSVARRLHRRAFLRNAGSATASAAVFQRLAWTQQADPLDALAELLPGWLKEHYVAGATVAVLRKNKTLWVRALGLADEKTNAPVNESTVFQAASLSKPVFAYAVLSLVAEKKFALDRPLTAYTTNAFRSRMAGLMASEAPPDARLTRITPRMVLRHATGLPNWARGKPLTIEFEPGKKFGYSGEGYTYLQNVIEDVVGEPLHDFVQKRVLGPLRMDSSSFVWRADYDARAAIGHNRQGPQEKWRPRQALAAGTLHATAGDYARFLAAMLRPQRGLGLDEAWLRNMLTPETRIDESLAWGLGWGLEKAGRGHSFWQWGDDGEFKAFAVGNRESQTAAVILTNGANGLRVCRPVIERVFPGPHPLLGFPMLQY